VHRIALLTQAEAPRRRRVGACFVSPPIHPYACTEEAGRLHMGRERMPLDIALQSSAFTKWATRRTPGRLSEDWRVCRRPYPAQLRHPYGEKSPWGSGGQAPTLGAQCTFECT